MNEQASSSPSRSAVVAQFFNRLHRYKNLVASKWWVLVACVGVTIALIVFFRWNAPPSYLSSARMIVGAKAANLGGSGNLGDEITTFFGTQKALMESEIVSNRAALVLQRTMTNLNVCPVSIAVTVSPKTSIFTLKAVGDNPEYTQAFLDAVMDEYASLKKEMRTRVAGNTKTAIQDELKNLVSDQQKAKTALMDYQSSNSVVFLQNSGNSAGDHLADLTRQQAGLKSELQLLKMLTLDENLERQQSLAQQSLSRTPNLTPSQQEDNSVGLSSDTASDNNKNVTPNPVATQGEYLKAKQQILLLKAQREELSLFLRPKHPKIIALDEDIARKDKLLGIFSDQSKEQLKNLQHSLELQIQNLDSGIKEWEKKSLEISKKMSEYQTLREDGVRVQNLYDRLVTVDFSLDLEKDTAQDLVSPLAAASPATLVPPQILKWIAVATVLGLALGGGILMVVDYVDDRPGSLAELQELVDEEILGQIPRGRWAKKGVPMPVLQPDDERHALAEAYRNLRSSIMFLGTKENHPRILLVTSAIPGDGKSMTSANLAITLAHAGARVLLIDADLRRGVLHNHFGVESGPGFGEVLNEECDWTQVIKETSTPNLTMIPRGSPKRHPGELFVKSAKDKLLKEITGQYDYILFDTAPVMAADDVSNLAPHVDGVLMVVRAGYTSGRVAQAALALLYQRKTNVLGLVFNAVRPNASEYYYYHYKDYYAKNPTA